MFSITSDVVSGGAILLGAKVSPDGQSSLESVSTFGVTARGAVAWEVGASGPAPAPEPFYVGLQANSRTLYMIEYSRASDPTTYLRALKLPSPSSSPSASTPINVGAIVGGVLGGIALATASFFVFVNRAALFGKASIDSQPLVPGGGGMLSQRQVSMPAWGQAPRATAPTTDVLYQPPGVESGYDTAYKSPPSFKKSYK